MKNKIILFSTFIFFSLLTFAVPRLVKAENSSFEKRNVTLGQNEVINGNYYAAGETVEILGTINGDAYIAGGQVFINGTINGDLLVAGGTVTISGQIKEDVRAVGGQITVNAKIGKNLSVAGGNLDITETATINSALHLAGGNLTISSPIAKEIIAAGGNLTFRGLASNNFDAFVGNLTLSPTAKVKGNLNYWSEEKAMIDPSASVSGSVNYHQVDTKPMTQKVEKGKTGAFSGFHFASTIYSLLTTLIAGLFLLKFFPNYTQNAKDVIIKRPLKATFKGLLTVTLYPFLFILSLLTIILIPFAFLSIPLFMGYLYIARVFVILAIGAYLTKKLNRKATPYVNFFLGLFVYYLISLIPILGGMIKFTLMLTALGAGLINEKTTYKLGRRSEIY
ncbi:hypothetical protein A2382_03395 [Candidatus Woesebacteria bacterium RIFOXYB1_FULL_38_16]|uniref:DUF8173 domain-containing protein n=1 Tax=Candidatus Woesebacteria bacterium RIFOXYB1_FULL_38_16 TaxID=1802538 RepID=A0A1F8CRM9_9BACT|nr:MAG: hypothetical protein A2191_03680 [Candidatus Woesebacteria bacterium RIFOXYA1_FULL_38_9]OGM78911.1 MAG: hypothetical protein A2382_03395 [Candidatus Woesebacteria bacterium RIFOXYB1_FULL_38_16]